MSAVAIQHYHEPADVEVLEPFITGRLAKDVREAARGLSLGSARYLVDLYYQMQKQRIRLSQMAKASAEAGEPTAVIELFRSAFERAEHQLRAILGEWAMANPVGSWLLDQTGIGPVIAAGLIAHCWDKRFETVSALWRFAGLDPTRKWTPGEKRPWNARLKTLCAFILGESFVKVQSRSPYGQIFAERKRREWERNLRGEFTEQARERAKAVGADTNARLWYSGKILPEWAAAKLAAGESFPATIPKDAIGDGTPMLPPAHIHARARRVAVKVFLAHFWEKMYEAKNGAKPQKRPWVFDLGGHCSEHYIPPQE